MMLSRFKLYSVHVNPEAKRPYETAVFIPEGFNIFAFIFTEFWALYNRLWILAFVITMLFVLIYVLGQDYGFHMMSTLILQLGIRIMMGLQGNDVVRERYKRKGYMFVDMVAAHSLLEAELRFYDKYLPHYHADKAAANLAEA